MQKAKPAVAELLNFCAFLAPDAIPETIIVEDAPHLGNVLASGVTDPIELDLTFREVIRYSLIHREEDAATLSMHRLVQAVLRESMPIESQKEWMRRAVLAVESCLSSRPRFSQLAHS